MANPWGSTMRIKTIRAPIIRNSKWEARSTGQAKKSTIIFFNITGMATRNAAPAMEPNIETIFLNTHPDWAAISSTTVRDIIKNGGNVKPFLASGVQL